MSFSFSPHKCVLQQQATPCSEICVNLFLNIIEFHSVVAKAVLYTNVCIVLFFFSEWLFFSFFPCETQSTQESDNQERVAKLRVQNRSLLAENYRLKDDKEQLLTQIEKLQGEITTFNQATSSNMNAVKKEVSVAIGIAGVCKLKTHLLGLCSCAVRTRSQSSTIFWMTDIDFPI